MTFALELDRVHRRFGPVEALVGATLHVRQGTIHALLGENGAGKTTLMRIAYGMLRADAGVIRLHGRPVTLRSTADAIALGVGMVHQHFTIVPAMTVAENVALGMHGRYDPRAATERVVALGRRTGLVLDPHARADALPVGAQQRLEIVKALAREARLLILDEPTAVLAPREAEELLEWVRRFRDQGGSVVLITHKLREAHLVADDVTVLRRGATVLEGTASTLHESALVAALLGQSLGAHHGAPASPESLGIEAIALSSDRPGPVAPAPSPLVASLRHVVVASANAADVLHDVSLDVYAGEIVGVAAVEGSGQRSLLRVLAGRLAPTTGSVRLPDDVAFVPEDRHRDALVLDMTLVENLALRGLSQREATMPWRALHHQAGELLSRFDVRAGSVDATAAELSGGNQQKFVLGRELANLPSFVVTENPTRGLDIRATAAVLAHLRAARNAGSAVVVYSTDLDEVLALADRVVVVHAGRLMAVDPPERELVGRAMLGAE